MQYLVAFEFVISRRIPWEEDRGELQRHLETVAAELRSCGAVDGVAVRADLVLGRLDLEVGVSAENEAAAMVAARSQVANCINRCGGTHQGLLPERRAAKSRPRANAWWGLRTPSWQYRHLVLSPR